MVHCLLLFIDLFCAKEALLPLIQKYLKEFHGDNIEESTSYGRIVNDRHFLRLMNLIDKSKVVVGGESNQSAKYISPTVMFNVKPEDRVMGEEIFGPILPVITVSDHNEAINFINERPKPLALYVFSNNDKVYQDFINKTSSGQLSYNEVLTHIARNSSLVQI
jgi:acyl-CoA reductase-like NAD-dependent aldehyde dehydrogenase